MMALAQPLYYCDLLLFKSVFLYCFSWQQCSKKVFLHITVNLIRYGSASKFELAGTRQLSLTCNNTACVGIREPNAVAFSSCERSEPPSLFNSPRCLYIIIYIYIIIYKIVRKSFRKCTSFLNSEYNFQFYWRVINVQQYRVRRNPRAQRCSVF